MKVIICGGGIMSTCLAHYLIENGSSCVIIEKYKVGCAASGKAGGFLAKDWCKDTHLGKLAKTSFELHKKLAAAMNGEKNYDFRTLKAFSLEIKSNNCENRSSNSSWIDGNCVDSNKLKEIGTHDTTAQLHPYKFVQTLTKNNLSKGAILMENEEVCDFIYTNSKKTALSGVSLSSGKTILGDAVVIAMGPWSGIAAQWFKNIPSFYGQKAHSITIKPSSSIPAEAIFTEFGQYSPEIYPRPDGELYVCGMAENPIPSLSLVPSSEVSKTPNACEKIKDIADMVSSHIKNGCITCNQACYMPLTHDGLPVIGAINGVSGLYVIAGHGCWGILNAPASGKALADLITKGDSDINIQAFNPNRFQLEQ